MQHLFRSAALLLALVFLCANLNAQSSCRIKVNSLKGCIPHPVQFDVDITGPSVKSYYWTFGDGSTSTQKDPNHLYSQRGTFKPTISIVFTDGTTCTQTLSTGIRIFDNPKPNMDVADNQVITLCKPGDTYCFKDRTLPGADGALAKSWLWSFGNGSISTLRNPCYTYTDSGTYAMALEVVDSNGCKSLLQRNIKIRFATQLGLSPKPKFTASVFYDCQKNIARVTFNNLTDTVNYNLTKFTWDFGDGTKIACSFTDTSCLKKWLSYIHDYTQSGNYSPSLTVENKNGCKATYVLDTSLYIQPYKMKVYYIPSSPMCFAQDSLIEFYANSHQQASYYIWDFGDPLDVTYGRTAASSHKYKQPGIYTVRFRTKVNGCLYDTTLCNIEMLGPMARIMPNRFNLADVDSVGRGSYLIPVSEYPRYFDTACYAPYLKEYYTYNYKTTPNADTVFTYCNATISKYISDTILDCQDKPVVKQTPVYKPNVVTVKARVDTSYKLNYWFQGTSWPSGSVYAKPPLKNNPFMFDDTTLFAVSCKAPHTVKFTNYSIKHRGYDARDNYPLRYKDTCLNPSFPYASDSLNFFWDFKEGNGNTSTKKSPDPKARYSEEKIPTHVFTKDGCYWVILKVTDPATGCEEKDSVPVVLEQPDAGWGPEYSGIKNMTWLKQQTLPKNYPRRGLVLYGPPCVNQKQVIDLNETLPSCFKREYAFIPDSAAYSKKASCDTNMVLHEWIYKIDLQKKYNHTWRYTSQDTGWKTVGLAITNNYGCTDTVWYHNYKYIHKLMPQTNSQAKHICVGDIVKLNLLYPEQPGIKLFKVKYEVELDRYDIKAIYNDTLPYIVRVKNGLADTITSTTHNPDWGITDPSTSKYNSLYDTLIRQMNIAGHVRAKTYMYSRFGCIDSAETEFVVGHYSDFFTQNTLVCTDDTVSFEDGVYYFLPFSKSANGINTTNFWANPDSARNGRKPAIPEKMEWDFDGDGIIDFTGVRPKFKYTKPGRYTVKMISTDSLGCRQVVEKKNYINVVGTFAHFNVDSPAIVSYCAPHFYHFSDSSYIIDSSNRIKISSWTWDFDDGTPPLTITDPSKKNASHLYMQNGDYNVKLTINTSTSVGAAGKGCPKTYTRKILIVGPRPDFEVIGAVDGCVPFTIKVVDRSKSNSKIREWRLGDGTIYSSNGEDTVLLTYKRPGYFCPEVVVTDEIRDIRDSVLYCTALGPAQKCKYLITVHAINKLRLFVDTLFCVDEDILIRGRPDTGYTSFILETGDGGKLTQTKPDFNYAYKDTGKYTLTFTGTNGRCPDTASAQLRVIDVLSDFYLDSTRNDTPYFAFVNTSRGAVRYRWTFSDGSEPINTTSRNDITHEFLRPGTIKVCLHAFNQKDCEDINCKEVEIITDLWIPNVFTPQEKSDGFNDRFRIRIRGERYYDLVIYNRWGEVVFRSKDKNDTWNGKLNNTGKPCAEGTYYYVFKYRHIGDKDVKQTTGTVTLLR